MELGGGVYILVKIVLLYTRFVSRLVSFGGSAISKKLHFENSCSSLLGDFPFGCLGLCDGLFASSDLVYIALGALLSLLDLWEYQ